MIPLRGNQVCVIGSRGFLGGALAKRSGDVTSFPTIDTRVVFHFGSHTHPTFERNPHYLMKKCLDDFSELLPYCYRKGILFVYPSSALIYEQDTTFSRFKLTLEKLASCYQTNTLGLRLFPVYGPTETNTVISQWCRGMAKGERPVVYGDGKQSRDFIYIDDAIDQIVELVNESRWGQRIIDIGTGRRTSFNSIIEMINSALGTAITPRYVTRPSSYSEGIVCAQPRSWNISIDQGIQRILTTPVGRLETAAGSPELVCD